MTSTAAQQILSRKDSNSSLESIQRVAKDKWKNRKVEILLGVAFVTVGSVLGIAAVAAVSSVLWPVAAAALAIGLTILVIEALKSSPEKPQNQTRDVQPLREANPQQQNAPPVQQPNPVESQAPKNRPREPQPRPLPSQPNASRPIAPLPVPRINPKIKFPPLPIPYRQNDLLAFPRLRANIELPPLPAVYRNNGPLPLSNIPRGMKLPPLPTSKPTNAPPQPAPTDLVDRIFLEGFSEAPYVEGTTPEMEADVYQFLINARDLEEGIEDIIEEQLENFQDDYEKKYPGNTHAVAQGILDVLKGTPGPFDEAQKLARKKIRQCAKQYLPTDRRVPALFTNSPPGTLPLSTQEDQPVSSWKKWLVVGLLASAAGIGIANKMGYIGSSSAPQPTPVPEPSTSGNTAEGVCNPLNGVCPVAVPATLIQSPQLKFGPVAQPFQNATCSESFESENGAPTNFVFTNQPAAARNTSQPIEQQTFTAFHKPVNGTPTSPVVPQHLVQPANTSPLDGAPKRQFSTDLAIPTAQQTPIGVPGDTTIFLSGNEWLVQRPDQSTIKLADANLPADVLANFNQIVETNPHAVALSHSAPQTTANEFTTRQQSSRTPLTLSAPTPSARQSILKPVPQPKVNLLPGPNPLRFGNPPPQVKPQQVKSTGPSVTVPQQFIQRANTSPLDGAPKQQFSTALAIPTAQQTPIGTPGQTTIFFSENEWLVQRPDQSIIKLADANLPAEVLANFNQAVETNSRAVALSHSAPQTTANGFTTRQQSSRTPLTLPAPTPSARQSTLKPVQQPKVTLLPGPNPLRFGNPSPQVKPQQVNSAGPSVTVPQQFIQPANTSPLDGAPKQQFSTALAIPTAQQTPIGTPGQTTIFFSENEWLVQRPDQSIIKLADANLPAEVLANFNQAVETNSRAVALSHSAPQTTANGFTTRQQSSRTPLTLPAPTPSARQSTPKSVPQFKPQQVKFTGPSARPVAPKAQFAPLNRACPEPSKPVNRTHASPAPVRQQLPQTKLDGTRQEPKKVEEALRDLTDAEVAHCKPTMWESLRRRVFDDEFAAKLAEQEDCVCERQAWHDKAEHVAKWPDAQGRESVNPIECSIPKRFPGNHLAQPEKLGKSVANFAQQKASEFVGNVLSAAETGVEKVSQGIELSKGYVLIQEARLKQDTKNNQIFAAINPALELAGQKVLNAIQTTGSEILDGALTDGATLISNTQILLQDAYADLSWLGGKASDAISSFTTRQTAPAQSQSTQPASIPTFEIPESARGPQYLPREIQVENNTCPVGTNPHAVAFSNTAPQTTANPQPKLPKPYKLSPGPSHLRVDNRPSPQVKPQQVKSTGPSVTPVVLRPFVHPANTSPLDGAPKQQFSTALAIPTAQQTPIGTPGQTTIFFAENEWLVKLPDLSTIKLADANLPADVLAKFNQAVETNSRAVALSHSAPQTTANGFTTRQQSSRTPLALPAPTPSARQSTLKPVPQPKVTLPPGSNPLRFGNPPPQVKPRLVNSAGPSVTVPQHFVQPANTSPLDGAPKQQFSTALAIPTAQQTPIGTPGQTTIFFSENEWLVQRPDQSIIKLADANLPAEVLANFNQAVETNSRAVALSHSAPQTTANGFTTRQQSSRTPLALPAPIANTQQGRVAGNVSQDLGQCHRSTAPKLLEDPKGNGWQSTQLSSAPFSIAVPQKGVRNANASLPEEICPPRLRRLDMPAAQKPRSQNLLPTFVEPRSVRVGNASVPQCPNPLRSTGGQISGKSVDTDEPVVLDYEPRAVPKAPLRHEPKKLEKALKGLTDEEIAHCKPSSAELLKRWWSGDEFATKLAEQEDCVCERQAWHDKKEHVANWPDDQVREAVNPINCSLKKQFPGQN